MAEITISDLPAHDSNDLQELDDRDCSSVHGGAGYSFTPFLEYGVKSLQFALIGYVIQQIVLLAQSFLGSTSGNTSPTTSASESSYSSSQFNLLNLFNFDSFS